MDKINITEILKDKPLGMKLYTPIYGDVWLLKAEGDESVNYPILVTKEKDDGIKALNTLAFTAYGQYMNTGECLLFPSKNMRDWEKFTWERGDVLMDSYGIWCMFDGWTTDDYTQFYCNYSITIDTSNEQTFYEDKVFSTTEFRKVGVNAAKDFIASLEKKYGGRFSPETLKIEKPKQEFKDGDIMYVKLDNGYELVSVFKEFSAQKNPLVYTNLFLDDGYIGLTDEEGYNVLCDWNEIVEIRLATNEEKQQLFDALAKKGKTWNADSKEVEDLPKKYELKPFDKVLVRDNDEEAWQPAFYSNVDDTDKDYLYHVITMGFSCWRQCIPYEGNEELVGTSNKPKE